MIPEIEIIIQDRLDKLPPLVREAVKTVPWVEIMEDISKSNNLNDEQSEIFKTETTLAVLGIDKLENYPENLFQRLGLEENRIISITKAVDSQIITPIINFVGKSNFGEKSNATEQTPTQNGEGIRKGLQDKQKAENKDIKPLGIPPNNLPVIEAGETAHAVPHDAKLDKMPAVTAVSSKEQAVGGEKPLEPKPAVPASAPAVSAPHSSAAKPADAKLRPNPDTPVVKSEAKPTDYRYPGGKDPYREPIE